MTLPKQLSASSVTAWLRCPACWAERYVKKNKPSSRSLYFGSAMSEALRELHSGKDGIAAFIDAVRKRDSVADTKGHPKIGDCLDLGIQMLRAYSSSGIFRGIPEYAFNVQSSHLPIPIVGFFDLLWQTANARPYGVVEFKASSQRWDQDRVDAEFQGTTYWIAYWRLFQQLPRLIYGVFSTQDGSFTVYETYRSKEQCIEFLETTSKVWNEMQLAHDPENGQFPGLCSKHTTPIRQPLRKDKLVLPRLDLDG